MSDILFPAGFIVNHPHLDLEKIQYYANMWNVEHKQLGKGVFEGSLLGVHTPHIQLGLSHFSQKIMTQGGFPDGCIVLGYFSNESLSEPVNNFHNRILAPNEIVILTKNDELDFLTYTAVNFYTIVIEEALFYREFHTFFGDSPDTSIRNKRLYLKSGHISSFILTITSWISYLAENFPKPTNNQDYNRIEVEILNQLFSCIVFAPSGKRREKFQTKTVRDILHENIEKPIDISIITKELDIGTSQLHHSFKKEYGITPKNYLQVLRYNAVRKELLLADPNSTTITDIAQKYHFWQMGHFTVKYKKMFGEMPSCTLHKKI